MSRRLGVLLLALVSVAAGLPWISRATLQSSLPQQSDRKPQRPESVPGEILVRFRKDSAATKAWRTDLSVLGSGRQVPVQVERLSDGPEIVEGLRLARVAPQDTTSAIAALSARSDVLYAEPNYLRHKQAIPNDPRYFEQWNLKNTGQQSGVAGVDIKAEQAWDVSIGSRSVVVGVVDEGIDINHPDLRDNIWQNPAEIPDNGIDDDGNGFIDDVNGWDFLHNDKTVFDGDGTYPTDETDAHGTHVAGTIGASGNNGIGVVGVNWQVSLMSLKFLGPITGTSADLLKALAYAKMMRDLWISSNGTRGANIRVLNNSYGGHGKSQAELDAILTLAQSSILFVAAAGNDSQNDDIIPVYPSNYKSPNVISVTAMNRFQGIASFTNWGPLSVHLFAPGEDILSTTPNGTYDSFSGTSMASPHVAGTAALLCAYKPGLTLDQLRSAVLYSGDEFATNPFFTITSRRLNAANALQTVVENDMTPPAAVGNFHIATAGVSFDPREVRLEWNAPGDDGMTGRAASYETRFSDTPFNTAGDFEQARPYSTQLPATANTPQFLYVKLPYRHLSGYFGIRAIDNAGNAGAISSGFVSVSLAADDPYTMSTAVSGPLSTGGTPLGLIGDDQYITNYALPFSLSSYNSNQNRVSISTNGAIYFTAFPPRSNTGAPNDAGSSSNRLQNYYMIAGLWDDLRTDRRPGDDVYVVQPDPSRVIFRWQAVTFDTRLGPGETRGENPVNFEIELRRDGTILIRYGDGNHNTFPVVGISGGSADAYLATTHTSESALKDLGNAPTVIFSLRNPPPLPRADMAILSISDTPDPVGTGQNIAYTIEGLNYGPDDAREARITFPLPAGTAFVSCTANQGGCTGPAMGTNGTVTLYAGDFTGGFVWSLRVVARIDAPANTVLNATATISNFWTDPNPANNSKTTTSLVAENRIFDNVAAIAAGAAHSIVAKADGTVWAWGTNEDGELGDGSQSFSNFVRPAPVQALGITDAVSVAAAATHSLVLASDGTVWSFGQNFKGQVGDGSIYMRPTPVKVTGLAAVKAVSTGHYMSVAIKTDGTVWTWGGNEAGELGLGSADQLQHPTPAQVPGLTDVKAVDAGGYDIGSHTLALKNDGSVWTWGTNQAGELGSGAFSINRATPGQVSGLSNVVAASAGSRHSAAIRNDGTVWCWGDNSAGQLGDGTMIDRSSPVQVQGLANVLSVAAGAKHTIALRNDGTVWAWGSNSFGQLGDGTSAGRLTPVQVSSLSGVTAIAAGYDHNIALLSNGTARTWGSGAYGKLGDGTSTNQPLPVQVTGVIQVLTPTMFPDFLQFPSPNTVTVNCATAGAAIHYTTNGNEPTESDPVVTGPNILVQRTLVLKIKAWKNGYVPSQTKTGNFIVVAPANTIDDSRNFVRQHYLDFLNRNPDTGGWDFWTGKITQCGTDAVCIHNQRIGVSAAFFIELEFQQTGYVVYRFYRAAYGTRPSAPSRANITFQQFIADRAQLVGGSGLAQNTINLANNFVERPEFKQMYPTDGTMTNAQFVNLLFDTAGLTPYTAERQQQIDAMTNSGKTRAQVLLDVIEINGFKTREYNPAFVLMQYYGYLRRNPDQGGYDFWLNILNSQPDNFRGMVCSFLTSTEYQRRFGNSVTRSNQDCSQ